MKRLLNVMITMATMGGRPQSFIDARWITRCLRACPKSHKRALALRVLNLSPHYFGRNRDPGYRTTPLAEYLRREHERNRASRQKIRAQILMPYLRADATVLDYGCGPGYLARDVANYVQHVYACDISRGVLECARVINGSKNITYILAEGRDMEAVADGSIDLAYSFAVIQHVTDDAFNEILTMVARKLKEDGQIVFHVHLDTDSWKSEREYRADTSLAGRLRFRYGLNCFSRSADSIYTTFSRRGFVDINIRNVADVVEEIFDDVCRESLVTATKGRNDADQPIARIDAMATIKANAR